MIVGCIKENPEPIVFKISCHGVRPELELDKRIIQFDRVLLYRYDLFEIFFANEVDSFLARGSPLVSPSSIPSIFFWPKCYLSRVIDVWVVHPYAHILFVQFHHEVKLST